MFTETYKTSLKEIKYDLNKWKDIACSSIGNLNIINININVIININVNINNTLQIYLQICPNPYQIPSRFSAKIGKLILKFIEKYERHKTGKAILVKNKIEGINNS